MPNGSWRRGTAGRGRWGVGNWEWLGVGRWRLGIDSRSHRRHGLVGADDRGVRPERQRGDSLCRRRDTDGVAGRHRVCRGADADPRDGLQCAPRGHERRCRGARDTAFAAPRAGDGRGAGREARVLREALRADQGRRRRRGRRDAEGRRHARPRLQPPLPPRDEGAPREDHGGRARHGAPLRSDDDVSERAVPQAGRVARGSRGDAVRWADADGRARDRRDDRSGRRDRSGLLSELPPRGAGRERRHDVDAVSDEERGHPATWGRSRRRGRASASRCLARRARCGSKA